MGPGPDRAFSATTIENIIHRISGTVLDSADLPFYVMALLVLVADIFSPADGLLWDSDGDPSADLVVPACPSSLGFWALSDLYHTLDFTGLDSLAFVLLTASTAPSPSPCTPATPSSSRTSAWPGEGFLPGVGKLAEHSKRTRGRNGSGDSPPDCGGRGLPTLRDRHGSAPPVLHPPCEAERVSQHVIIVTSARMTAS